MDMNNLNLMSTLYSPENLNNLRENLAIMDRISLWCQNYLALPHPDLGRSGPICPFMPRSLELNHIYFAVVRSKGASPEELEARIKGYREIFLQIEPKEGLEATRKAIIVILPDVPDDKAAVVIDDTHRQLKAQFVESGLMIGKFHSRSDEPGLHNPRFRPLRSPIPMLAIRYMVETDLPFLNRPTDATSRRVDYLTAYYHRFDENSSTKWRNSAREALLKIQDSGRRP